MTKLSNREAPIKPGAPNEAPWLIAFFRSVLQTADRAGQIIPEFGQDMADAHAQLRLHTL